MPVFGQGRKKRRDFRLVARDAINEAASNGTLPEDKANELIAATNRPRQLERIRAAFVQDLQATDAQALNMAEIGNKIDFDALFDALTAFFPKFAKLKKFAPLIKLVIGLAG